MTDSPTRRIPNRAKTGRASRFVAAGAAVGVSMVAVGAMAAVANSTEAVPAAPDTQRVVLMPQPAAPQQIVIVLPNGETRTVTLPAPEPVAAVAPLAIPQDPEPPASVRTEPARAPVSESGGS